MSKVYLVEHNNHLPTTDEIKRFVQEGSLDHFLEHRESTTLLTKELLSRSFTDIDSDPAANQVWADFYTSALHALGDLGEEVVVFFSLKVEGQRITLSGWEWCEIRFASTGELIMSFTHDTRKNNVPFCRLSEWLEEDWEQKSLAFNLEEWSTVEKWKAFFLKRAQGVANSLGKKAIGFEGEAKKCRKKIEEIEAALAL